MQVELCGRRLRLKQLLHEKQCLLSELEEQEAKLLQRARERQEQCLKSADSSVATSDSNCSGEI